MKKLILALTLLFPSLALGMSIEDLRANPEVKPIGILYQCATNEFAIEQGVPEGMYICGQFAFRGMSFEAVFDENSDVVIVFGSNLEGETIVVPKESFKVKKPGESRVKNGL